MEPLIPVAPQPICFTCSLMTNPVIPGSFWCEKCIKAKDLSVSEFVRIGIDEMDNREQLRWIEVRDRKLFFRRDKDGSMICIGTSAGSTFYVKPLTTEILTFILAYGYKYQHRTYEEIKLERCQEWIPCFRTSHILIKCQSFLHCNLRGEIQPCKDDHYKKKEGEITVKVGIRKEGGYFIVGPPELRVLDLNVKVVKGGGIVCLGISPELSIKYKIPRA